MKIFTVFKKSMKEQVRDILMLSLTLVFAPFFVYLYSLFFPEGSTTYGVLLINNDQGVTLGDSLYVYGDNIKNEINNMTYASGDPLMKARIINDRAKAEKKLKNRNATVLLVIPENFSKVLEGGKQIGDSIIATVTFVGDLTNPYYAPAAVFSYAVLEQYVQSVTGIQLPVQVKEEALGASDARSEFEIYVPGIVIFATIMLVFLAAMLIAREVESKTLQRLMISRMTSFDFLGGVSLALLIVGIIAVILTFFTALSLGFRSQGPLWVAIIIGAVSSISIIGTGLIVACFSKTVNHAFIIANFPLALFMFFSGALFPIPKVPLFKFFGHSVGLYDFLPPTHAVVALNKVLSLGSGLNEVIFELTALVVLSALYYLIGIWMFRRIHLRALS